MDEMGGGEKERKRYEMQPPFYRHPGEIGRGQRTGPSLTEFFMGMEAQTLIQESLVAPELNGCE